MLLNYSMPQLAPNTVTAPTPTYSMDSILGLSPSQYSGFKSVANTPYYFGEGGLFETYTPRTVYERGTGMTKQTYDPSNNTGYYGMAGRPNPVGMGFGIGMGGTGWTPKTIEDEGTIYRGEQAFRPVQDANVAGFNKIDGMYQPSMAYVNSQAPKYQGNPQLASSPAINLTTPTANIYNGNYGAGRFLNTGNLLGFNFGTPSGQTAGGQATP